jgi:hypothetical protein
MPATFKIHPAVGMARVGNSPTEFYLCPEAPGDLPIQCNDEGVADLSDDGTEKRISKFKDDQGRVKRQAARFRVFVYDEQSPQGREVKIGDTLRTVNVRSGQVYESQLIDIRWTVYLANKKAVWYEFRELDGEHGYPASHPLRNADVTAEQARQKLIIDAGPRTVQYTNDKKRFAQFARVAAPSSPQTFPPPLQPFPIDTLGEIRTNQQNGCNRLIVLGGFGNSGSSKTEFGQPYITSFANNDGWFDDVSDGPVTAQLLCKVNKIDDRPLDPNIYPSGLSVAVPVEAAAWVIVGYPRYAPQIVDIVTMDDVVYDLAVRQFAFDLAMYRVTRDDGPAAPPRSPAELAVWRKEATWNPEYRPYFWRDVWPILSRPSNYQWVMVFDPLLGGDPHDTQARGNFDVNEVSVAPYHGEPAEDRERRRAMRQFLYSVLRQPGEENRFTLDYRPRYTGREPIGMPWLCGDNPLTNVATSKFLRLTDTMLFILRQWADGRFINEKTENITAPAPPPGVALDRGVLGTMLGGAFCPGGEACWIMRNPAIYAAAYRIHVSAAYAGAAPLQAGALSQTGNLAAGLEPGDITKYDAVPWQADFNECSTQPIDITYRDWAVIEPDSIGDPVVPDVVSTFWWPAHRPMEVFIQVGPTTSDLAQAAWTPTIPQTNLGDLLMVSMWKELGFLLNFGTASNPTIIQVEPQRGPGQ